MNEMTIETEMLKKAETLNLEIYSLFCKLDRYKDKLSEPLYKYMAERLYALYKEEFERVSEPYFLERSREKFQARERRETLTPHRWRPWYFLCLKIRENRAAKLIVKEIEKETETFFKECENRLAAERKEQPPQESQKREAGGADPLADAAHMSPKAGKTASQMPRGSTNGAKNRSEQAAPEIRARDQGEKTISTEDKGK